MKRKFLSLLLSLAMCLSLLPTAALADDPMSTYTPVDLANCTFSNASPADITTDGLTLNGWPGENVWYKAGSGAVYLVQQDTTYTLVLDNATVGNSAGHLGNAICLENLSANLTVELRRNNTLTGGLRVLGSSVKIVSGEINGSTPTLTVTRSHSVNNSAALLVNDGKLNIEGVNVTATRTNSGNAIGAHSITINRATVNATSANGNALSATGNPTEGEPNKGSVKISDNSTVNATANGESNDAIYANTFVTIKGGSTVTAMATGDANYDGDGGNAIYAENNSITIEGGSTTVTATATGNDSGSGEGANAIYAKNDSITVNGSTVNATSKSNNAINAENAVTIENSANVTATSTDRNAINAENSSVTISGSNVNATSKNSAAINATDNSVTISGSTVNATSENSTAINAANAVTINGSTVNATSENSTAINAENSSITISGGANVTATSGENGNALGVGMNVTVGGDTEETSGGTLSLSGGTSTVSGTFTVNDGATVNIAPGTTLAITGSSSLASSATFVNNGALKFDSPAATLPTNITGTGYVKKGDNYSSNVGETLKHVSGNITLGNSYSGDWDTNIGYHWNNNNDHTLFLRNVVIDGTVTVNTTDINPVYIVVADTAVINNILSNNADLYITKYESDDPATLTVNGVKSFSRIGMTVENLTASFANISCNGTSEKLTLKNSTVTAKHINWSDYNDSDETATSGIDLENSTLTVSGIGKYNDLVAAKIKLDKDSKIILNNAGATSGRDTLTMQSYKAYLPDGYLPELYNTNPGSSDRKVYAIMRDTSYTPAPQLYTVRASSVHAAPASAAEPLVVYASAVHADPAPTLTLATSLTLEPHYTVTFNPNGGTFSSTPSGFTANPDRTISTRGIGSDSFSVPGNPTRSGYTFAGWKLTETDGGASIDSSTLSTHPLTFGAFAANVTATAQWMPEVTFTVETVRGAGADTPTGSKFFSLVVSSNNNSFCSFSPNPVTINGIGSGTTKLSFTNNGTLAERESLLENGVYVRQVAPDSDSNWTYSDKIYFLKGTCTDGAWNVTAYEATSTSSHTDTVVDSLTFTNTYTSSGSGSTPSGSSATYYTLTAGAGANGSITPNGASRVRRGADASFTITPAAGYSVSRVLVDGEDVGAVTSYTFTNVRANHSITAYFCVSGLNGTDHTAYVQGYPDGSVGPEDNITRAQTAMMLYRLLTAERRAEIETSVCSFTDVSATAWYRTAVATMANGGYINGLPDGSFGGSLDITRAEFVTILSRFLNVQGAQASFTDVTQRHWGYDAISAAANAGWITGENGSFRPDEAITRAEAMAIINRVLNRGVNASSELLNFRNPPDNGANKWYYYEVIEATNGHDYTGERPNENWTALHN